MAVQVRIPAPLREHTQGQTTVSIPGASVGGVLNALGEIYPGLASRLFDGQHVKRFINIYVNDEDVRYLQNLDTPIADGDELSIIPAVAGG